MVATLQWLVPVHLAFSVSARCNSSLGYYVVASRKGEEEEEEMARPPQNGDCQEMGRGDRGKGPGLPSPSPSQKKMLLCPSTLLGFVEAPSLLLLASRPLIKPTGGDGYAREGGGGKKGAAAPPWHLGGSGLLKSFSQDRSLL